MKQEKCGICNAMVYCPDGDIFSHWRECHPIELNNVAQIAKKILDEQYLYYCKKRDELLAKITQTPS